MADYINIKALTLDELAGVVNLYPWYGAARKELCMRMAKMGGDAWGRSQYGDSALYVQSRGIIADILRDRTEDYSDRDLESLLRSYIAEEKTPERDNRPVRVVGGDYFTQSQYDKVRKGDDNVFSHFAAKAKEEKPSASAEALGDEFCTEILAQIYLEQGYYEQAKHIYSRLLLNFPEKNAYFASLIEKLEKEIIN